MRPVLFILSVLLSLDAIGQTFSGRVTDMATRKPLVHVTISGLSQARVAETDSSGNFSFVAKEGEVFYFFHEGYVVSQKKATSLFLDIELSPLNVSLREVTVTPYATFQSDSAEMSRTYGKELSKEGITPRVYPGAGLVAEGVISSAAQHFSKKAKQSKRFREDFHKDMEQKYIDLRYTPALVASLTGLKGDSVAGFMAAYPMDHEFARAATDLEIKAWIRQNYRTYATRKKG